jgi:hypothetical protein
MDVWTIDDYPKYDAISAESTTSIKGHELYELHTAPNAALPI